MVQDVIDRHRDLLPDLPEKFHVQLAVRLFPHARKSHGSQSSYCGGQGHDTKRVDAVLLHALNDLWPAMFVGKVRHEDRLLCEENQTGGSLIERFLMAAQEHSRHV